MEDYRPTPVAAAPRSPAKKQPSAVGRAPSAAAGAAAGARSVGGAAAAAAAKRKPLVQASAASGGGHARPGSAAAGAAGAGAGRQRAQGARSRSSGGGGASGWRPGGRLPPSPRDKEEAGAAQARASRNLPKGLDYEVIRFTGIPYPSGNHRLDLKGRDGSGGGGDGGVSGGGAKGWDGSPQRSAVLKASVPNSPLDDLLAHVNQLLKGLDRYGQPQQ